MLLALAFAVEVAATTLPSMPKPRDVMMKATGTGRLDHLARASAELTILVDVVASLAPRAQGGRWLDPGDQALYKAYSDSLLSMRMVAYKTAYDYSKWQFLTYAYDSDSDFIRATLARHVPASIASRYLAIPGRSGRQGVLAELPSSSRHVTGPNDELGPAPVTWLDGWITVPELYLIVGATILILVILGCSFLMSLRV